MCVCVCVYVCICNIKDYFNYFIRKKKKEKERKCPTAKWHSEDQLTIEAIYHLFGSSPARLLQIPYPNLPCNQIIPLPKQEQYYHRITAVTSLNNFSSTLLIAIEKLQHSCCVKLLRACDTFVANSSSQITRHHLFQT